MVSYSTYFNTLRTDVAGGSADDIFWMSNAYLAGYADSGRLIDIGKTLGPSAATAWEPSVVEQFTRGGTLWAVPQLTDAGIAVYYNADLLAAAGVDPADLATLRWSPDGGDTLRPLLARLTVDADGHTAGTPGFDAGRIRQWGYNAANDAAGHLPELHRLGGRRVPATATGSPSTTPARSTAFPYLVALINGDHVAPPASDTNDNGDFSRNQFLAGKMALFQSGTYNLAAIAARSHFRWGVAMLPTGPKGRVSVTNGIAAAGNSATAHPDAVRQVLAWMGSTEGNQYLGAHGAAIPAVLRRPAGLLRLLGRASGVDVAPFFAVLDGPRIAAPGGAGFAAGIRGAQTVFRRDVPRPQRCRHDAAAGPGRRQRRRATAKLVPSSVSSSDERRAAHQRDDRKCHPVGRFGRDGAAEI